MKKGLRTLISLTLLACLGVVAPASADEICSFMISTHETTSNPQCHIFSMPGSEFNVNRNYTTYGQLICPGGNPQLIYESNTQEISAKGTCYGINLFNNWLFGRCEPFWFENLNSGGHSWALHVESADAFVLEAIPVCFYPVYEDFSKTVSQRSCTQDPCPAPQPQPPPYEQWDPISETCYNVYSVMDYYYCYDGCFYDHSEYTYLGLYCY